MTRPDVRLYLLIDPAQCGGHDPLALARLAVRGGVSLVQLRDKRGRTRDAVAHAKSLKKLLAPAGVPLLVNDRVDVALAARADGVHLGQDDMPAETARKLLGPRAIIGLSVRSEDEARAAPVELIDYVGLGGVFETVSKTNTSAPVGLDGLARIAAVLRERRPGLPVCAIAGINETNAGDVIRAGADGVAVISAIAAAADPGAAARRLRDTVAAALKERAGA